jgi:hypothetical protein
MMITTELPEAARKYDMMVSSSDSPPHDDRTLGARNSHTSTSNRSPTAGSGTATGGAGNGLLLASSSPILVTVASSPMNGSRRSASVSPMPSPVRPTSLNNPTHMTVTGATGGGGGSTGAAVAPLSPLSPTSDTPLQLNMWNNANTLVPIHSHPTTGWTKTHAIVTLPPLPTLIRNAFRMTAELTGYVIICQFLMAPVLLAQLWMRDRFATGTTNLNSQFSSFDTLTSTEQWTIVICDIIVFAIVQALPFVNLWALSGWHIVKPLAKWNVLVILVLFPMYNIGIHLAGRWHSETDSHSKIYTLAQFGYVIFNSYAAIRQLIRHREAKDMTRQVEVAQRAQNRAVITVIAASVVSRNGKNDKKYNNKNEAAISDAASPTGITMLPKKALAPISGPDLSNLEDEGLPPPSPASSLVITPKINVALNTNGASSNGTSSGSSSRAKFNNSNTNTNTNTNMTSNGQVSPRSPGSPVPAGWSDSSAAWQSAEYVPPPPSCSLCSGRCTSRAWQIAFETFALCVPPLLAGSTVVLFVSMLFPLYRSIERGSIDQTLFTAGIVPMATVLLNMIARRAVYWLIVYGRGAAPVNRWASSPYSNYWALPFMMTNVMAIASRLMVSGLSSIGAVALSSTISGSLEVLSRYNTIWRDRRATRILPGHRRSCCGRRRRGAPSAAVALARASSSASMTGVLKEAKRRFVADVIISQMAAEYWVTMTNILRHLNSQFDAESCLWCLYPLLYDERSIFGRPL